jgi:Carboxypeptidase regulatory-like domain
MPVAQADGQVERTMRRAVTIISIVLLFAFAPGLAAQDTSNPNRTIVNLKQQLLEIEALETESRIRLEELNEQLKRQNIEWALAGIGSVHPEELREYRRKLLTIERDGIKAHLDLLEEIRARINAEIAAAEFAEYLKYALPSPTPSPVVSSSNTKQELPVTASLRGAIITTGPDGHSYNIPGANLKLQGETCLRELLSDEQGEYEFATLEAGKYTLVVSAPGFKTAIKAVTVRAREILIADVTLEVSDIYESTITKPAGDIHILDRGGER